MTTTKYMGIKKRNMMIFVLILVAGLRTANGCSASDLSRTSLQGNITHVSNLRFDDCTWRLPTVDHKNHALVIILQTISLNFTESDKTGCAGVLILPELGSICNMPPARCFFYIPKNSICEASRIDAYVKNVINASECSSKFWYDVTSVPTEIQYKAKFQDWKGFSLTYNIIKCKEITNKESSFQIPETNSSQGGDRDKLTQNPGSISGSSSATAYIVIIVILVIILILALLVICRSRLKELRNRKSKDSEKPLTTTGYISAEDLQQTTDQPPPTDDVIQTNHYEEIPQTRFQRSESREYITNEIYSQDGDIS